jgi:hypothetical protein
MSIQGLTDQENLSMFSGTFFHRSKVLGTNSEVSQFRQYFPFLLSSSFLERLRDQSSNEFVIHIRSGDVYSQNPHRGYGQPPLSFYVKAISFFAPRHITIISEDHSSPVLSSLIRHLSEVNYSYEHKANSLIDDIIQLASARTLIASRGTFCTLPIHLSDSLECLCNFHDHTRQRIIASMYGAKTFSVKDKTGDFILSNIADWNNSPVQRSMLSDYPLDCLELERDG